MSLSAAASTAATASADVVTGNHLPSDWSMERLAHAEFSHSGQDLRIVDGAGHELLVKGYFLSDAHSDLQLDGGIAFRSSWADRLSGGDGRLAQAAGNASPAASIGTVKTLNGTVTVEHADGTRSTLQVGDAVHQGDVLETGAGGAVGIVFLDGSNFSLGAGGKMILDEMVYDPGTQSGSANVGVLSGTFAFISGQIAKTSPDAMKVTTPSATIGFRGTSGSGQVGGDGQTSIVLIRDPDGTIGEIVLVTPAGVFTLSTVLQAAQVSINPATPVVVQTMTAAEFSQQYGAVTSHLPAAAGNPGFVQGATQGAGQESQEQQQDPQGQEGQSDQNLQQMQQQIQQQVQQQQQPQPPATTTTDPLVDVVATLIATVTQTTTTTTTDDNNNDNNNDGNIVVETPEGTGGLYSTAGVHTGTEGNDVMTFVGAGNVTFYGLEGDDVLTGYSGNDVLDGSDGNDTLYGGAGGDTLLGGDGDDLIVSGAGANAIDGGDGTDILDYSSLSTPINAELDTDSGDIIVTSGTSADTVENVEVLIGTSGNDQFSTLGGVLIQGGAGNDTLYVTGTSEVADTFEGGDGTDFISFDALTGAATINAALGTATWDGSSSSLAFSGVEVIEGSDYADSITGSTGADTLYGSGGNDTINGGNGDDVIYGGSTDLHDYEAENKTDSNSLHGGNGNDTLHAGSGTSQVYGDAGNDTLYADNAVSASLEGGTGDDTLVAGSGDGALDGGDGTDTADFSGLDKAISISFENSSYFLAATTSQSYTLDNLEVIKGTDYGDNLIGMGGVTFLGGAGDDTYTASSEYTGDSFDGGDGSDTLDFSESGLDVTLDAGEGTASWSNGSSLSFSNVEVFQGGSGDDDLTGSTEAETFIFSGGADTFHGGGGNDTAAFSGSGTALDHVSISGTTAIGMDSGGYTVGTTTLDGIETLIGSDGDDTFQQMEGASVFGGGGADSFYVSADADFFDGGSGNDLVRYEGGTALGSADTFIGGEGTDTITFSGLTSGDSVSISYSSGLGAMLATFSNSTSTAQISGFEEYTLTNNADTFTGSSGADTVSGMDGNDTFYASFGGDTYSGGEDVDTLTYANLGGKYLNATLGTTSSIDILCSESQILGTDTATLMETLIGSSGDDSFTFESFDTENGAIASVAGGDGNDTFAIDATADTSSSTAPQVTIDGGSGTNVLDFSAVTSNVTVDMSHADATYSYAGTGSSVSYSSAFLEFNNISTFKSSSGEFTFTGGSGDETVYITDNTTTGEITGGTGSDTIDFSLLSIDEQTNEGISTGTDGVIYVGKGNLDVEVSGFETLIGSSGNDVFHSLSGYDDYLGAAFTVYGGAGDDTYQASYGDDTFHGGTGNDTVILDYADFEDADTFIGGNGDDTLALDSGFSAEKYVEDQYGSSYYIEANTISINAGSGILTASYDGGGGTSTTIATTNFSGFESYVLNNIDTEFTGSNGDDTVYIAGLGTFSVAYHQIDGGSGDDTLDFSLTADEEEFDSVAINAYFIDSTVSVQVTGTSSGDMQFSGTVAYVDAQNIETLVGSTGDDVFGAYWDFENEEYVATGLAGMTVFGGEGADAFYAGSGNEVFIGGAGNDHVTVSELGGTDAYFGSENGLEITLFSGVGGDPIVDNDTLDLSALTGIGSATVDVGNGTLTVFDGSDAQIASAVIGGFETYALSDYDDTFIADDTAATVDGGAGDDTLTGGDGDDSLSGGDGNDILHGGAGADSLSGGDGNDILYSGAGDDHLDGGAGDDLLYGGAGNDELSDTEGTNLFLGSLGNDTVTGSGSDALDFSSLDAGSSISFSFSTAYVTDAEENEYTTQFSGIETLIGSSGDDYMEVSTDDPSSYGMTFIGGDGDDTFYAVSGLTFDSSTVTTIGGIEYITFTDSGQSTYFVASGFETFYFGNGGNTFHGTSLGEYVEGGSGDDTFYGLGGNDTLVAGEGSDYLDGGDGSDLLIVGSSGTDNHTEITDSGTGLSDVDTLQIDGTDASYTVTNLSTGTIKFYDSGDSLIGQATVYSGIDVYELSSVTDTFTGSSGGDTVIFGGGNDTLHGGEGDDTFYAGGDLLQNGDSVSIDGGADNDTLSFENVDGSGGISAIADDGTFTLNLGGGNTASGTFSGIETFRLTDAADGFTGSDTDATTVFGLGGNDGIVCRDGVETIGFTGSGETVADVFASMGLDYITNFASGTDSILLDAAAFTGIDGYESGDIVTAATFDDGQAANLGVSGAAVFIYNDNGSYELWYTTDGSAATTENSYQFAASNSEIATTDISVTQEQQGG